MKALDQRLCAWIGLWVEPLMRVPVAGKETFEAQNIGMIGATGDHRPAGTPIEKADTAKDQGAHDVLCPNGQLLRNPSDVELPRCIGLVKPSDSDKIFDVVRVVAGPAGL